MGNFDWKFKRDIEEIVEDIAVSRVSRFYPTYFHKITDYPLQEIFDYLLELVRDNRLNLLYEIRCPNYECHAIIKRTNKLEKYLNKTVECDECENEIFISRSLIFPVFEVNEKFREELRQIKKKVHNLEKEVFMSI